MSHPDLFRRAYDLRGKDWLKSITDEDRLVFSRLGHARLRELGIELQSLGGKARVGHRCDACGKFTSTQRTHTCEKDKHGYTNAY